MFSEPEISIANPALLRYNEASFFLSCFRTSCGPPHDSYFEMIAYIDAFLFCLISVEDMLSEERKKLLRKKAVFKFLKAARNITGHHTILASPNQHGEYVRPFSRAIIELPQSASARLRIKIKEFRDLFETAAKIYPSGRSGFKHAKHYLESFEAKGLQVIYIEDVLMEGLNAVRDVLDL